MKKYLYLTRKEWVKTWVDGGKIPIPLASKFLSATRRGTQTTDEIRYHRSESDIFNIPFFHVSPGATIVDLTITGTINGQPPPQIINANCGSEDGLIISLANRLDRDIAEKLGKSACVEIHDVAALKAAIDEQLGTDGIMGECEYTDDHQRDTFLKSREDEWQKEFRIYWPIIVSNAQVILPAGLATEIEFDPALNPLQIESIPEKIAAEEFLAKDLERIKAMIIGYIRATRTRAVSKLELCNLLCDILKVNYDRTYRVISVMTRLRLVREVQCPVHSQHVELTDGSGDWKPRIEVEIPDPNERLASYWEYPFKQSEGKLCPSVVQV